MTPRSSSERAFMLVDVLAVVVAGTLLCTVLVVTLNDAVYLQRTAAAHVDRKSSISTLTRQWRRDALATMAYRWDGTVLSLDVATPDGALAVQYAVAADKITRVLDGAETHAWQAVRLRFTARLERGPRASLLHVDLTEQAPPRATVPSERHATLTFLLPPQSSEEQP